MDGKKITKQELNAIELKIIDKNLEKGRKAISQHIYKMNHGPHLAHPLEK